MSSVGIDTSACSQSRVAASISDFSENNLNTSFDGMHEKLQIQQFNQSDSPTAINELDSHHNSEAEALVAQVLKEAVDSAQKSDDATCLIGIQSPCSISQHIMMHSPEGQQRLTQQQAHHPGLGSSGSTTSIRTGLIHTSSQAPSLLNSNYSNHYLNPSKTHSQQGLENCYQKANGFSVSSGGGPVVFDSPTSVSTTSAFMLNRTPSGIPYIPQQSGPLGSTSASVSAETLHFQLANFSIGSNDHLKSCPSTSKVPSSAGSSTTQVNYQSFSGDSFQQMTQGSLPDHLSDPASSPGGIPSVNNAQQEPLKGEPEACLFVASLNAQKTDEQLTASVTKHFAKWGSLLNVKVMKDWMNRPYAFVQYVSVDEARRALDESHDTIVDGRHIRVEQARVNRTLFLGKLPKTMTDSSLKAYFEKWGKIESVTMLGNNNPSRSRGCAYVKFRYREDAIRAYLHIRQLGKWSIEWATNVDKNAPERTSQSVCVSQLNAAQVTEQALQDRFEAYGIIEAIHLFKKDGEAFAIIRYEDEEAAQSAVEKANGCKFLDAWIRVQYRESPETPRPAKTIPATVGYGGGLTGSGSFSNYPLSGQRYVAEDSFFAPRTAGYFLPSNTRSQNSIECLGSQITGVRPINQFPPINDYFGAESRGPEYVTDHNLPKYTTTPNRSAYRGFGQGQFAQNSSNSSLTRMPSINFWADVSVGSNSLTSPFQTISPQSNSSRSHDNFSGRTHSSQLHSFNAQDRQHEYFLPQQSQREALNYRTQAQGAVFAPEGQGNDSNSKFSRSLDGSGTNENNRTKILDGFCFSSNPTNSPHASPGSVFGSRFGTQTSRSFPDTPKLAMQSESHPVCISSKPLYNYNVLQSSTKPVIRISPTGSTSVGHHARVPEI